MEHSGKYPFPGHDALTHFLKDLASVVALLADLGQLQHHIIALKFGANGHSFKVKAGHDQIFSKSAVLYLGAPGAEFL